MTEQELNEAKLELEREKFEFEKEQKFKFEKEKAKLESGFFYRNAASIITAAISLAALSVSISQVWVADIARNKEIETTRLQKEKELQLAELREDRRWKYDSLQFISSNKESIFSKDELERKRIRDVIVITFPPELSDKLFSDLEERGESDAEKDTWIEGQKEVDKILIASPDLASPANLPSDILSTDQLDRFDNQCTG